MKTKLITTIMITLFLASMLSMAFVAPVAATPNGGIVGLWHFDEGTGSTAYDSSGFDNDGTLSGGKFGNALEFDGTDDYVRVPGSGSLDITDKITVEAWIKPKSPYSIHGDIVRRQMGYQLCLLTNGKIEVTLWFDGVPAFWLDSISTIPIPATRFYHVAFTYDKDVATNNLKIYIDGALDAQYTVAQKSITPWGILGIGAVTDGGQYWWFTGIIDEVRISNVARASFDLTKAPEVDADTVALWHFDESVDPTVYDEADTPDADDGTIYGAKWAGPTWTTGVFDDALAFDGVDDYVMVPDSSSLRMPSTEVTIEAWIYFPSSSSGLQLEIRKWIDSDGGWASYVLGKTADNKIYAAVQNKVLGQYPTWMTTTISALGIEDTWAHIAFTWKKGAIGAADGKIFVNGVSVATTFTPQGYSGAFTIGYGAYPLYFARKVDAWPSNYFKGKIDEVCIWNRALLAEEIILSKDEGVPFFIISATPPSQTMGQGQAASYDVSVDRDAGIPVSLSISGLPSGAAATFTPSSGTPPFDSTLFVTTTTATPSDTYTLTITGTGGGVTKSTTVTLIVAPIQKQSFMTDSQFIQIGSFDTVFTPDKATSSLKLTATNPGTYYYNKIIRNTGASPLTVTIVVTIPESVSPPGPTLAQAFLLKGSNPIHVFSDLARTIDVTGTASITPAQPLSTQLTSVPSFSITVTIPAGELRYVTAHLDFAGKGSTGFTSDAPTNYRQGFKLRESITIDSIEGTIQDVTTFTGVGKRATAIGGFALDTNLNPKSALQVKVLKGSVEVGSSGITLSDGFYFVSVPAGGPYTVQLYNPATDTVVKSTSVASVAVDEFVQVDFLNINPADPAIEGFVFDASTKGVAGVTVQLYDGRGKLMASTKTSASGWYAFRFSAPGTYTVKITVPSGYKADKTSVTVSIKQFETLRVDFNLK